VAGDRAEMVARVLRASITMRTPVPLKSAAVHEPSGFLLSTHVVGQHIGLKSVLLQPQRLAGFAEGCCHGTG
jgi:hypothetical protein